MPLRQTPAAALPHSAKRQPLLPLVTPSADARTNATYMPPRQYVGISNTRILFMPLRRTPAVTLSRSAKRQPLLSFVNAVHRRAHACRVYVYADMLPRRQRRRVRHDSAVRAHARVTAHMHVGSSDVRALFMPLRQTPVAALPHSAKRQPLLSLVTPSTNARTNATCMPPRQYVGISNTRALFMPLRQTPAATLPHSAKRQPLLPLVYAVHRRAHAHHVHIHAEALPRGQFRRARHNSVIHAQACVAAPQSRPDSKAAQTSFTRAHA